MSQITNVYWAKLAEAPGSRTQVFHVEHIDSKRRAKIAASLRLLLWRLVVSSDSGSMEKILRCFWIYRRWQTNARLNVLTAGWL